jgi:hypothetical protein
VVPRCRGGSAEEDVLVLISLAHKFLFVANVKSASSSIERALRAKAEIAIMETRFGKHAELSVVSRRFPWLRQYVPYSDFFVFGVIREPVDWILSLYNFHTKADFDGLAHSTKGVSFGQFLREGVEKRWQMRPQHLRFTDEHGRFEMNHLLDFANLEWEFPRLSERLGLGPIQLARANASPEILTRPDLPKEDIAFIEERFAADYQLLENRPRAF